MQNSKTKEPNLDFWPRIKTNVKKYYSRFVKIRGNPREIALGFALGIFVGMTPFMGFHTAIAVFFAALFKWNKISAALSVWITNPFSAPIIYSITYYIGAKVFFFRNNYELPPNIDISTFSRILLKAPEIIWTMTVGGIILGIPLAIFSYYFAFSAITKYRESIKEKLALRKVKKTGKRTRKKKKKK